MDTNSDTSSTPPRVYARMLACSLCQQRKVKCDRNSPCSNCIKAGVTCTPSAPSPSRPRRRPNQDLRRRLARCEELLLQCATPPPSQVPDTRPSVEQTIPTPPVTENASPSPLRPGVVVQEEGKTRLIDSYIWASLFDELRNVQDIVEMEDASAASSEEGVTVLDKDTDLLLSGVDPSTNVQHLQPDPLHVFRLWQLFLDRVNPVTKIIHVPTVQPYIIEATTNILNIPLHYQALLFSIYTMAVVSVTEQECIAMFGMSRDVALGRYTLGAKASLVRFNFLKNENMAILQALILFLCSLQNRYDRHASWILSGIILRIAHKMGYHRDGSSLNLTPFETEMRRRIWWHLMVRDSTYASLSSLTPSLLPIGWDTKEPSNLNDADLFPKSTEPFLQRSGPTEMAFCIVLYRILKLTAETNKDMCERLALETLIVGQSPDGKNTPEEIQSNYTKFRQLATSLDETLKELEEKYIDPKAGNTHIAAHGLGSMLTRSLFPAITPMQEQPEWGVEILTAEDKLFKILIGGHEHLCDAYEVMLSTRFEWWMSLYFQPEGLTALAGQLCQRPVGSLADRAWKVIDRIYRQHPELLDLGKKENRVLARYALKAWEAREAGVLQMVQGVERPVFIGLVRERLGVFDARESEPQTVLITGAQGEEVDLLSQIVGLDTFPVLEEYGTAEGTGTGMTWDTWELF